MIYLNRNKSGYGWYSQIKSKEGQSEIIAYIRFSFKKGTEPFPQELGEYGSYQGELIFRDTTGKERKVYPIAKEYNGIKYVEFKLMDPENEYVDPQPSWIPKTEPKWDMRREDIPTDITVDDEDIPW